MNYCKSRWDYLRRYWNRELNLYLIDLQKSKKLEERLLTDQMESLDRKFMELILKLYLERCKFRHSLVFFQWRMKQKPGE